MTYLSIIDKLKILFDTMMDFEFILVFIILLIIFTFLYLIKKLSIKRYIVMLMLSFVLVFGISIIGNYEVLSNTFDDFATIFFGNIYFPSIYVYIAVLIISFTAFMVSILNVMLKKIYKIINSVMFILNNILFVIILNIIAKNNIDIFSVNSLYTDTSLVAILELSMGLFILWVLSLITVYVTDSVCFRFANKRIVHKEVREKVHEEVFNPVLEVSNDIVSDVNTLDDLDVVTHNDSVEVEAISNNELDLVVEQIDEVTENNLVMESGNNVTFNDILNGCIPVTYYDNSVEKEHTELVNPQMIYEDSYNKLKNDNVIFNDINISLDDTHEEVQLSVEEMTLLDKEKISEERLVINTISLNDLIDKEEDSVSEVETKVNNNIDVLEVSEENIINNGYTVDDYKKIIKMLTELKNYSNSTNINMEDALAISLIKNYSIDDCIKFRNILENNLN